MNISRSLYESRFEEIFKAFAFVDKIKSKKVREKQGHNMKKDVKE